MASSRQEAKVHGIIAHYRRAATTLHPLVADLSKTPELSRAFWRSFDHDLLVFSQRSQNLEDSEITAAQKAFVFLSKAKQDQLPAIELYVEEILGILTVAEAGKAQTLVSAIQTRDYAIELIRNPDQQHSKIAASLDSSSSSFHRVSTQTSSSSFNTSTTGGFYRPHDRQAQDESLFLSEGSDICLSDVPNETQHPLPTSCTDDKSGCKPLKPSSPDDEHGTLLRLCTIYHYAKADFHARNPKSLERTKAAKFLRDTTENLMAYIASRIDNSMGSDAISMDAKLANHNVSRLELDPMLKETIAVAEKGSGGKKRSFDEDWTGVPSAPAMMRQSSAIDRSNHPRPGLREPVLKEKHAANTTALRSYRAPSSATISSRCRAGRERNPAIDRYRPSYR